MEFGKRQISNPERAILILLGLALLARFARFGLRFPMSGDECYLAVNIIQRSFSELTTPLSYSQVSPVGFLWAVKTMTNVLGIHEWSFRIIPMCASVLNLGLFFLLLQKLKFKSTEVAKSEADPVRPTSERHPGTSRIALLACAMFAGSYYLMRHGVELKPYSSDVTFALVLTIPAVELLHRIRSGLFWALLFIVVPVSVLCSFPAVFTAGGIVATLLVRAVWCKDTRGTLAAVTLGIILTTTFAITLTLTTERQYQATFDNRMGTYWASSFPPHSIVDFTVWLLRTHTGRMFGYPIGGENGASFLTFLCFGVGILAWFRQKMRWQLILLVSPFLLTFIAAALERYPYGGSARINLYLSPAICILAAVGLDKALSLFKDRRRQDRLVRGFCVLSGLLIVGSIARDIQKPYKTENDWYARAIIRDLWSQPDAAQLCSFTDMKLAYPSSYGWRRVSKYLCNTAIYQDRVPTRPDPTLGGTFRLIGYDVQASYAENGPLEKWVASMSAQFSVLRQHIATADTPEGEQVVVFKMRQISKVDSIIRTRR